MAKQLEKNVRKSEKEPLKKFISIKKRTYSKTTWFSYLSITIFISWYQTTPWNLKINKHFYVWVIHTKHISLLYIYDVCTIAIWSHRQKWIFWNQKLFIFFNICVRTCWVKSFYYYNTLSTWQQLLVVGMVFLLGIEWISLVTISVVSQFNQKCVITPY